MSKGHFTQLTLKDPPVYIADEVTDIEISLATTFSSSQLEVMKTEEREEIQDSFKKVRGVLFDTNVNDHGFAMSSQALEYMVVHFNRTQGVGYLHNFFKNHDFMNVDAMLGRVTDLSFDPKTQQMTYEAILSNKHSLVQRVELMKSVSGTIIRGALECNTCGDPYSSGWFPEPSCDHIPNGSDIYPVTHKAIHIETSFVTFPAYKMTSVETFNALQEKYNGFSSFSGVLNKEFPEDAIDNKAEVLAQLQTAEAINNLNTDAQKVQAEEKKANLNSMMQSMSGMVDLLGEAIMNLGSMEL